MNKKLISIVVPCYNEQETLSILHKALTEVTEKLEAYEFEYLFVDDGSSDQTLATLIAIAKEDAKVKYYSFSRNFGKEAAIYAGLSNARGEYVAIMDADMQDPPSLLGEMIEEIENNEDCDNVATRRVNRKGEPVIRSFFAHNFYKIMRMVTDIEVVDGARDFRMMRRDMVDSILAMCENNRFSKGIFAWVGYKTKWIEYQNVERAAGETKWNFWKLFLYSLDGIMNFSNVPITITSYIGFLMTIVSFIAIIFVVVRAYIFGDPVAGWPSLVCIITFLGGIQLFCMGIMGQYIARTYTEVKKRPHYIIRKTNGEDVKKNN